MDEIKLFSTKLSRLKEEAKKEKRLTGKQLSEVQEELAKTQGFCNYKHLQQLAKAEGGSSNEKTKTGSPELGGVVADVSLPPPTYRMAYCRSPAEFRNARAKFGNPVYAVTIHDAEHGKLKDKWYFSNDLQEAVAIGLRWHERNCALEQYPVEQDGKIVFRYQIRGLPQYPDITDRLYFHGFGLWEAVGSDCNTKATPQIMTGLREGLFKSLAWGQDAPIFCLLDFSEPDECSEFMQDWADEFENYVHLGTCT